MNSYYKYSFGQFFRETNFLPYFYRAFRLTFGPRLSYRFWRKEFRLDRLNFAGKILAFGLIYTASCMIGLFALYAVLVVTLLMLLVVDPIAFLFCILFVKNA